jgi:hypothetical protein
LPIHPGCLFDFRGGHHLSLEFDSVEIGQHACARCIGRRRGDLAKKRQGRQRIFMPGDFTARLHKRPRAALAHQQQSGRSGRD